MPDKEVLDFVKQIMGALNFLERRQIYQLLAGPKSIAVVEEERDKENRVGNWTIGNHTRS